MHHIHTDRLTHTFVKQRHFHFIQFVHHLCLIRCEYKLWSISNVRHKKERTQVCPIKGASMWKSGWINHVFFFFLIILKCEGFGFYFSTIDLYLLYSQCRPLASPYLYSEPNVMGNASDWGRCVERVASSPLLIILLLLIQLGSSLKRFNMSVTLCPPRSILVYNRNP